MPNEIEIHIHLAEGGQSKAIKIAEDATIGQLLEKAQAAGAAIGEPGEEIILWVEDKESRVASIKKSMNPGLSMDIICISTIARS